MTDTQDVETQLLIDGLREEIRRLRANQAAFEAMREALEFYADAEIYRIKPSGVDLFDVVAKVSERDCPARQDWGMKARAALALAATQEDAK